jgi:type IV pilus assembly protein PilV
MNTVPSQARQLRFPKRQGGFTLIEVLVSAMILSIGLVGVAGLQVVSLKNNQSAYMRSQVSAMAYDLADRMRSNVSGAEAGFYDPAAAATRASCLTTVGCSAQQLAQNDLAEWTASLDANLPMGTGFVCIDSTPYDGAGVGTPECDGAGTQFSVKVWWDDNRDGAISITEANTERSSITFQL